MSEINMSLTWAYKITQVISQVNKHISDLFNPFIFIMSGKKAASTYKWPQYHRMLYYTGDLKLKKIAVAQ